MKKRFPLLAVFGLLVCASALHAQVLILSTFGNSATADGSWLYNPATSTLSGTTGIADSLFGIPLVTNIGTDRYLRLSANVTTAPSTPFTITLEDNAGHLASANYTWSEFAGGATSTKAITFGTFDFTNITTWSLSSSGVGDPINASFSQLAAVPEPSTWLLITAGLSILMITRRRILTP